MAIDLSTNELIELPEDSYIFVWRERDNAVYVTSGQERIWQDRTGAYCRRGDRGNAETSIKHTQIAERSRIYSAGKLEYRNGKIEYLNNSSGHFQPSHRRTPPFIKKLQSLNVATSNIQIRVGDLKNSDPGMAGHNIVSETHNQWKNEETNRHCPGESCFNGWVVRDENSGRCTFTERVYSGLVWKTEREWRDLVSMGMA